MSCHFPPDEKSSSSSFVTIAASKFLVKTISGCLASLELEDLFFQIINGLSAFPYDIRVPRPEFIFRESEVILGLFLCRRFPVRPGTRQKISNRGFRVTVCLPLGGTFLHELSPIAETVLDQFFKIFNPL